MHMNIFWIKWLNIYNYQNNYVYNEFNNLKKINLNDRCMCLVIRQTNSVYTMLYY
jgi:hypothetical protein